MGSLEAKGLSGSILKDGVSEPQLDKEKTLKHTAPRARFWECGECPEG